MNETKAAEQTTVKDVFMGSIPLDKIEVAENVRARFDAAAMKDLTASIKHHGVQVPVIVVAGSREGTYKLVAGERRVRAARSLDFKEIPARVIEADEATQADIQVLENLQREDLGPIEEARGFKKLLDAGQHTIEGLAKRVDKSVKYVTRSIRLLELPKAAIRAIEKGALTPEHGHQLLRAPEDKREALTEYALNSAWGGQPRTIRDLAAEIERRLERDLSRACFPKDREYAGAAACAACPFNTGNQDALFDGAKEGKCTNGSCFAKKTNLFMREFRDRAAKHFEGVKFAGFAGLDYDRAPREVGGSVVLTMGEAKSEAVKALLKKDSSKLGFAVLKPGRFGSKTPTAVLVCNDRGFVEKKLRKSEPKVERGLSPEEQKRESFLQDMEVRALFLAAGQTLKAVKKEHLVDVVLRLDLTEEACAAAGVEAGEDTEKALMRLSEKDLLRLAWLSSVPHYEVDERFGGIGVEVKKVRKEARVSALAEWERLKKEETEAQKAAEPGAKEAGATK